MSGFVRTALARLVTAGCFVALSLLLLEAAAQWWVANVARQGKLFEPDPVLGWRVLPNLDLERATPFGGTTTWQIRTDETGRRGPGAWRGDAALRLLILGDSFAFGEGIDVADTLDHQLLRRRPEWSVINLGVMGFGTDQELIAARPFTSALRAGDCVLLLTCFNDFYDIQRSRFSGRSKPWFELGSDGSLVEHPPESTWRETWRERSYSFSMLLSVLERKRSFTDADIERGTALYEALIRSHIGPLVGRGVRGVIAYHGLSKEENPARRERFEASIRRACASNGLQCLALDPQLDARPGAFFPDGHWTAVGHRLAAEALAAGLAEP